MWGSSQNTIRAAELSAHVFLVRFQGAASDLEQLRVTPEPLDSVFRDVTVPSQHLDCAVGNVFGLSLIHI